MNVETAEFMKARAPYTKGLAFKLIKNVKFVGGGTANECYNNAHLAKEKAARSGKRIAMVSGWIVNKYSEQHRSTSIIAHWWNSDMQGNHFDTTPNASSSEHEYVQDSEIFKFCYDNDAILTVHQHYSLMMIEGNFEVLFDEEKMLFRKVNELKTEHFYN